MGSAFVMREQRAPQLRDFISRLWSEIMLSVRRASAKNTAADVRSSQPPLLGAQRSGIISLAESDASETFTLPIFLVPERLSYSTPKHVGNAFGGAPRFQKAQRWGRHRDIGGSSVV